MHGCFHSQISMTLTMNRILFVLINLIVLNCVAIKCANDFSRNFGLSRGKRSTESILDTGQLVRLVHDVKGNITSGRVEVYLRDRWVSLCGEQWSIREANIVCKQIGYIRGAISATHGSISDGSGGDKLNRNLSCPEQAQSIQDCEWNHRYVCHKNEAARVHCQENAGCPDTWVSGPSGCYQMPGRPVTRREFALKRCKLRGAHLVNIETEAENDFLSNVFSGNSSHGPILTGGTKVDGNWLWEQGTTEDESQSDDSTDATTSVLLTPLETLKWFPGWHNGSNREPSTRKKNRCLFLSNFFHQPGGGIVDVDYFFWTARLCYSTRKHLPTGFRYICEKPREPIKDFGCYTGDGRHYRGRASYTSKGSPCINWTGAPEINPTTYPHTGLGNHSFCRNPDRDDKPWCWTSKDGEFGFCPIPRCSDDKPEEAVLQPKASGSTCKSNEFMCSDKSCITDYWHCDVEPDCPDGEDETGCDYKIVQFTKTSRRTIRYHTRETYVGATNETCAKLCLSQESFVCRSFSFSRRTRECRLSDKNSLMKNSYPSRREDYFEVTHYLDGCPGMFKCTNGRCIKEDLECNGQDDCMDLSDEVNCASSPPLDIRLTGGDDRSGSVEISYLGQWGMICDDNWGDADALVACRMLGYEGTATAVGGSYYGSGSGRFLLDEVKCVGNETSLDYCKHNGWTAHDCHYWEAAGVQCSMLSTLQVELVNGEANSGRVEITYDGIHGTVCDDKWDNNDARVICRMLGYSNGKAHDGGYFGPGSSSLHILLDDVDCTGEEKSIADCSHSDWLVHDCVHAEDAGVTCFNKLDTATVTNKVATTTSLKTTSTEGSSTTTSSTLSPVSFSTVQSPTPKPEIECYKTASSYKGNISKTSKGKRCQRWSSNSPHKHKHHDDKAFPDGSVAAAKNYCRSPDNDTVPWCYTQDRKTRWGYCDVPRCAGSKIRLNQNITCGLRPLEAGRYRRDADTDADWSNNYDDEDDMNIDTSVYRKLGRIIGGASAEYGMFPWQAGIRNILSSYRRLHTHKCGATIIDEYWVLSAAHCFRNLRKKKILIRTGDHHNRRRDEHEQEFQAAEVFMHAGYNSNTYDYDIALVKLKPENNHGVIFNDHVQPACLPQADTKYEAGKKCFISGWGTTEDDIESYQLKSARVPLVDDTTCNRLYKWSITENMVCAGYIAGGVDACTGDSGGPLVCDVDGIYTIMGVTSFGEGCAVANAPGVYTRVTALLDWIHDTITENT